MNQTNLEVFLVLYKGDFKYYRCDRDYWVLDLPSLVAAWKSAGHDLPPFSRDYRFGIHQIDSDSADDYLRHMAAFEISKDQLSYELATRFLSAHSFWDVKELFPVAFIDFDSRRLAAFYDHGLRLEKYVPETWEGTFSDFLLEYPESVLPSEEKFWVKGKSDLLKLLNERGAGTE